jgi:hypothetical protein
VQVPHTNQPYEQTNLKNRSKSLFEQMGTMLNLLTAVLTELNSPCGMPVPELKTVISVHNIDVMLISEMHFTEQSYLKLLNYHII